MKLYFRMENRVMKRKTYFIYRVNPFLLYYKVKNRVPLEHFYSKLYFRIQNRVELEITFLSTLELLRITTAMVIDKAPKTTALLIGKCISQTYLTTPKK